MPTALLVSILFTNGIFEQKCLFVCLILLENHSLVIEVRLLITEVYKRQLKTFHIKSTSLLRMELNTLTTVRQICGPWIQDRTGFIPFQDFFRTQIDLFQDSQMHNNGSNKPNRNPKIILQKIVFKENFITRVYRFPGLSRTCSNFPGLSSVGKCQNKIPGLSRISRTHMNSVELEFRNAGFLRKK